MLREFNVKTRRAKLNKNAKKRKEIVAGCAGAYSTILKSLINQYGNEKEKQDTTDRLQMLYELQMEKCLEAVEKRKDAIKELERKEIMRKYPTRATTLVGKDRYYRRYYVFGSFDDRVAD